MKSFKININSFKLGCNKFWELKNNNNFQYMGAKKLLNFIPRNNNLLTRRPGSIHITNFEPEKIKAIKFITVDFGKNTFLLEFTVGKLRLFKNNILLYNDTGYPLEIQTPYVIDYDINSINCTKKNINNSIYIFCKDIRPHILTIDVDKDIKLTLQPMEFVDGPYADINTTNITVAPEHTSGTEVYIKASADIFTKDDIDRHFRLYDPHSKTWGWAIIYRFVDSTYVQVNIKKDFGSTKPSVYWRKGAFNTSKDSPSLGVIFNSRLYLSNTSNTKTRVWASCYNDFLRFSPTDSKDEFILTENIPDTITYSSAITFVLNEIKEVKWISNSSQYVVIGSQEGIFGLMPLDFSKSLAPYNFIIHKIVDNGSSALSVICNSKFIGYINDTNNITILEYSNDLLAPKVANNILSNEVINKKNLNIIGLYLTSLYENIIIVVFNDGSIGFININIIDNESIIYAFSEVLLGGTKSIIKAVSGNDKYLYLIVERSINDKPLYTLEYIDWKELDITLEESINLGDIQYLDCRIIKNHNKPTKHIVMKENDNIAIIGDDYYLGEFTSNNSYIILQQSVSKSVQGYNYISHYTTLDFNDIETTASLGSYKKLYNVTIGYINSLGGQIFVDENNKIDSLYIVNLSDLSNKLFTGYKKMNTNFSLLEKVKLNVIHNKPFPLNISFIGVEILCN